MAAVLAGAGHGSLTNGATPFFPSNERVCNMYRHGEADLWGASHANYYFSSFMNDNGGVLDNWLQRMHVNATADAGITTETLHCDTLHTDFCSPPGDGDCELYNPAAFQAIRLQAANVHAGLQAIDINNIKTTLSEELSFHSIFHDFMFEGEQEGNGRLGVSQLIDRFIDGFAAALFPSSGVPGPTVKFLDASFIGTFTDTVPQVHHALTPEQVEVAYKEELGGLFDRVSDFIEDFTATLFGGKPTHRINLRRFVAGIDKDWAEGKPRQEWEAVQYLLSRNFPSPNAVMNLLEPAVKEGFRYLKLGLIGHILAERTIYVVHYTKVDRETCLSIFEKAARFLDDGCYVLKRGNTCLEHNDNAPHEIYTMQTKYGMNVTDFFHSIRDCDNDRDGRGGMAFDRDRDLTRGYLSSPRCAYRLKILLADTQSMWDTRWVDMDVADSIGVKVPITSFFGLCL